MRKLFLMLILLGLVSFATVPTSAQSDCDINLEDVILQLIQAQRQADSGNNLGAVGMLQSAIDDLEILADGCANARVLLPQEFVAPDESIGFRYPADWVFSPLDDTVYIVATSQDVISAMSDNEMEVFNQGDMALFVFQFPLEDEGFDATAQAAGEDVLNTRTLSRLTATTINGRDAYTMAVEIVDGIYAQFEMIDYSDAEEPVMLLIGGISTDTEFPIMQAYLSAFVSTVQYPPVADLREIGVSLAELQYSGGVDIDDINEEIIPQFASLAPDGGAIAWYDRDSICTYRLILRITNCAEMPDNYGGGRPRMLYWSPDSRYITFHQDFFRAFYEADIWLYDVAANTLTNLTDDNDGGWRLGRPSDTDNPVWFDAVTTWGADGTIYVSRTEIPNGQANLRDDGSSQILRVSVDGETELIRDITVTIPPLSIPEMQGFSLDGTMSVSPDASQLAFVVYDLDRDSGLSGVWVMDLDGASDPYQLVDTTALLAGVPVDRMEAHFRIPESIAWDAEGDGLFAYVPDYSTMTGYSTLYHIDVASSQVTVLNDLSNVSPAEMTETGNDGLPGFFHVPRYPIMAADYSGVIYLNNFRDDYGLTFIDANGNTQTLLEVREESLYFGDRVTIAHNGTILIGGALFQPD